MLMTPWLSLFRAGMTSANLSIANHDRRRGSRMFPGPEFLPAYASRYSAAHWTRTRMRHHLRPRQRLA